MKIGLVGYPGAGKSTVFGALTGLDIGHGTHDKARVGVVKVPDPRVDALAALYEPKKKTYAEVTFTDLGGGHGKGVDRAALVAMRPLEALCQVVRGFAGPAGEAPDPLREIEGLAAETILADLELVEQRLSRLAREHGGKGGREADLLQRIQHSLESEHAIREMHLGAEEQRAVAGYAFLTQKPLLLRPSLRRSRRRPRPGGSASSCCPRRSRWTSRRWSRPSRRPSSSPSGSRSPRRTASCAPPTSSWTWSRC
jgi:ribosome-binding ATPase YchF (GTP1/OBG family)